MRSHSRALLFCFATFAVAACSSEKREVAASSPATGAVVSPSAPSTVVAPAIHDGTYYFVLDESDVHEKFRASCAAEKNATACLDAIREQAAREGIRIEQANERGFVWISFGIEDEREVTYLKWSAQIDSAAAPAALRQIWARPLPPFSGTQADSAMKNAIDRIQFEVPDPATLVMRDPRKGRLVFRTRS